MSSIRVVARIRPPNSTTTSTGKQNHGQPPNQQSNNNKEDIILTIPSLSTPNNSNSNSNNSNSNIVSIPNPKNPQETYTFAFSSVYDSSATQQDIFDREVAPAIKPLFNGVDVTVFAYGVTGTGKTFTMRGGKSLADRGVIPRLLSGIYRRARKIEKDTEGHTKIDITLSYYEIYNDKVYDLFEAPEKRTLAGLPIRDNGGKTVVVGLTDKPCANLKDFEKLYDQANINRSTSATKLNAASSRSHAIMAIKLVTTKGDQIRVSTASAIDLAGSEDNRRTDNGKERMVESASINKSLFTLAKCVEAISQGQSRIPYRESKMTRILSLGQNNGLTIMILNLAPTRSYHLDTLSSLNFANRTKKIEVRAVENEPIYLGCARSVPTLTGDTIKRQPLRPLTTAAHNSSVGAPPVASKLAGKSKAFMVYSDNRANQVNHKRPDYKKHSSPLKRRSENGGDITSRPTKRRSVEQQSHTDSSSLTKQAIEDIIDRKVADALATRALGHASAVVEPDISDEVRKRLEKIEQRIEGQESNEKGQGLTFLLCAKQHAVRGEDRSALKMYLLAKDFFPNHAKLDQKIEKLKAKLQSANDPRNECMESEQPQHENDVKRSRKVDDGEEDFQCDKEDSNGEDSDTKLGPTGKVKRRKRRKEAEQSLSEDLTPESCASSPRAQRLLRIIESRDVKQIGLLRGVGPKRAGGIIEALEATAPPSLRSLAQLSRLKGVGIKLVEKMKAGLPTCDNE